MSSSIDTYIYIFNHELVRETSSFSFQLISPELISLLALIILIFLAVKNVHTGIVSFISLLFFIGVAHIYIKPQDDLYSNLLTVYNYIKFGIFSVDRLVPQEGSVEYVFYYLISIFSGSERNQILYYSVMISGIFGWLNSILAFAIAKKYIKNEKIQLIYFIFTFLLSKYYIDNLFSGYGYNLFVFIFLLSFYFLLNQKQKPAMALMAMLPVIRQEGIIAYPILIAINHVIFKKKEYIKKYDIHVLYLVSAAAPFLFRLYYYGHILPVPGVSKQSPIPHWPAIVYGGQRLFDTIRPLLTIGMCVVIIGLIVLGIGKIRGRRTGIKLEKNKYKELAGYGIMVLIMTAAYKVHGGDFLYMNRYDLIFYLFFGIIIFAIFDDIIKRNAAVIGLMVIAIVVQVQDQHGPLRMTLVNAITAPAYREVRYFNDIGAPYKEGLAYFINEVYPDSRKKIAVIELNTFGYFSNHKIYDMMGTTNKEIAFTEPYPRMDLFKGYKKRNPELLEDYKPDIIVGRHANYWDYNPDYISRIKSSTVLDYKFYGWGKGCQEYELGGEHYLNSLNYTPILLIFKNIAFSAWIRDDERPEFEKRVYNKFNIEKLKRKYKMIRGDSSLAINAT